jgi:cyclic lactone autoinducer peptide
MKKIMSFIIKHSGVLAAIALVISVSSLDSVCYMGYHQSKIPEALNAYRR